MKRLHVHIGHYKTGTSAIQKYCSDNARHLAKSGFYYPPVARPNNNETNHGDLSLLIAAKHGFVPPPWYGDRKNVDDIYDRFLKSARKAPQEDIVISSEEFYQLALRQNSAAAIAEFKERVDEFDVRILMFIRDPMELLKSWYNEVNKSPQGTRPFPVFFKNLDADFLSQRAVWQRFADAFGEDAVRVRSYKFVGLEHIRDFLEAIGCQHTPEGPDLRVQEAQDVATLELIRLSKRRDIDHDDATLSRTGPIKAVQEKISRINVAFAELSARSDVPIESSLSLENLFLHHERLIRPLVEANCMNRHEATLLRDFAIAIEANDPRAALALMRTAKMIRPNGEFINSKLREYESRLQGAI